MTQHQISFEAMQLHSSSALSPPLPKSKARLPPTWSNEAPRSRSHSTWPLAPHGFSLKGQYNTVWLGYLRTTFNLTGAYLDLVNFQQLKDSTAKRHQSPSIVLLPAITMVQMWPWDSCGCTAEAGFSLRFVALHANVSLLWAESASVMCSRHL